MIKVLFGIITLLTFFKTGSAQSTKVDLDNWLNNNAQKLGGRAVLLVYKNGEIVYHNSANNITNKQKKIAKFIEKRKGTEINLEDLNADSKIAIASCSKWFTAVLAMTFVDEGKLQLEDSIGKYLPNMTHQGKGSIKIWQCLSHLTGIKSSGIKEDLKEFKSFQSMEDALQYIANLPIEGPSGKTFRYSNVGLQIIAAIIEKISNQKFQDVFHERIAKPLQMNSTDWGDGKVPLAAGGARSTANDYLKFTTMILNKGKVNNKIIISEKSIQEMQIDRIMEDVNVMYSPTEAGNWGYGFGEWVMKNTNENSQSNAVSSPGLFGTFPWVDNQKKYTAILFTYNLKNKERHELYTQLKELVDSYVK